jgi:hypothetical protein
VTTVLLLGVGLGAGLWTLAVGLLPRRPGLAAALNLLARGEPPAPDPPGPGARRGRLARPCPGQRPGPAGAAS